MTSTIIELSRITSNNKISNSQWKNSIKSGMVLEDGDQVLLKNCYIDTTNLSPNNIIISEDIVCTITFGIYMTCTGIEQVILTNGQFQNNVDVCPTPGSGGVFYNINSTVIPDGLPYRMTNRSLPDGSAYIDTASFTVRAGTYSKTFLGEYISRKLQSLNVVANERWTGVYTNKPQFPASSVRQDYTPPYPVIETLFQPLYLQSGAIYNVSGWLPIMGIPPISVNGYEIVITPASYPVSFDSFLQNLPLNVTYNYGSIFGNCKIISGSGSSANYDAGYVGCPNMSISFNADSQKYQFDYLHTSITDNNQNELVSIAYSNIQGSIAKFIFFGDRSGIMITNLEPKRFWFDMLGFKASDIIFNDPLLVNVPYSEFYQKTTRNFQPISEYIDIGANVTVNNYSIQSMTTIINDIKPWRFSESTATDPIIASDLSKGTIIGAGHYLVDIKGYNTQFKNEFGDTQYKGVVSAFFLSADSFLCSPSPDSSFYQHHGSPVCINSLEVSIIDPLTHTPSQNLGGNSSVYIQVIKANKKDGGNGEN